MTAETLSLAGTFQLPGKAMRRKWLILGVVATPVLLVATLAAFVKQQSHVASFRFLNGAELVLDKRVGASKGPVPAYYREISYNVRGDFRAVIAAAAKELTAAGYTEAMGGMSPERLPIRLFLNDAKVLTTWPAAAIDGIMLTEGRGFVVDSRSARRLRSGDEGDGWVVVEITQFESEPSWLQRMIATVLPPPANTEKDVDIVYGSGPDRAISIAPSAASSPPRKP